MGRFKADEFEHYGARGTSNYFSLKNDKDVARVRFMYNSMDDIDGYAVHEVQIDGRRKYVNCLREYNEPIDTCPFCKNHMAPVVKLFIPLYNEDTKKVQVWERGKKFYSTLASVLSRTVRDSSIVSQVFEIERNGMPKDTGTTYGIYPVGQPDGTKLSDLPILPDILGQCVLDKSAQEMEEYLHNGEFSDNVGYNSSSEVPIRRRGADRDDSYNQPVRRTPSRREDVY